MSDVAWLYDRLPHSGAMCLVDEVVDWDRNSVRCRASSHRHADNPLRVGNKLPAICALEYAAQAFALHALLVADEFDEKPPDSSRVSVVLVNSLKWHVDNLDDCRGELTIDGKLVFKQTDSAVYCFEVSEEDQLLVSGKVGLMSRSSRLE